MAVELLIAARVTCAFTGEQFTGPMLPLMTEDGDLAEGDDAEEALREELRVQGWRNIEGNTWASPTCKDSLPVGGRQND